MSADPEKGPIATNGAFFFLGIIGLSSYLDQWSSVATFISFLLCYVSLLSICFRTYRTPQSLAVSVFCLMAIFLTNKNPFVLIGISSIFYLYLSQKSLWEKVLWKTSCAMVALLMAVDILAYWGLPGTIILIWYWSLPPILFLILLFRIFPHNRFLLPSFLLFCAISLLFNQVALTGSKNECIGVTSDSQDKKMVGMSLNLLRNITERGLLKKETEARQIIMDDAKPRKWLISLVATPSLNPEWLFKNALAGEYYVFAEHDNLTSFIGKGSPFNSDSFQRKGPWDTYKPVMSSLIERAANKDILYCSNIGCTLKMDLRSYPLVWDYTPSGVPIILAKGLLDKGRRFVFVGDSDPTASFLAPYNPFWLRALLGMPTSLDVANACLLILLAAAIFFDRRRTLRIYTLIGLTTLFYLAGTVRQDITPHVDVSVSSTGKWTSPHYISNFSSMPKNLIENDHLLVSIQRPKSISQVDVRIITKTRQRISVKHTSQPPKITLLILTPGSSIVTQEGITVAAGELPMGAREVTIENKKLIVEDARDIKVAGNVSVSMELQEHCYVIATGSPQRLGGLGELISR